MAHMEEAQMATTNASWECRCSSVLLCISDLSVHAVLLIQLYDSHDEDDSNMTTTTMMQTTTMTHATTVPTTPPASTPVITRAPIVIPDARVGARLSCVWPGATTQQCASLALNLLWLRISNCFQAASSIFVKNDQIWAKRGIGWQRRQKQHRHRNLGAICHWVTILVMFGNCHLHTLKTFVSKHRLFSAWRGTTCKADCSHFP